MLQTVHGLAVGVWLGCVLTEALFERALLGKGRDYETVLAALHTRVDLLVELPAIALVLATGLPLVLAAALTPALAVKLGFAGLAIAANLYCVQLVFARDAAAKAGNWPRFETLDHRQHKAGAVVLLAILAAAGIGVFLT
ncbi:hypothetical protein [Phenylobacterium sp.]|uniref:hypothetical protein n=1 Tax=Phenylobacterium sp. TaxID=1871053 RepID=UPI0035AE93EE